MQKRPKIKLNRAVAVQFGLKKFGHSVARTWSRLVYAFHKLSQPVLAIDKHRGSEMFAALSLHRLAIFLAFLMSLNILLLLIVPYVFYICDDSVACNDWNFDNATNVVNIDGYNYVEGFFHNLQLPIGREQSEKISTSQSPILSSQLSDADSSHYQLPFFYGYYRLGVTSDASRVATNRKLYKSSEQDEPAAYDYAFADGDANSDSDAGIDVTDEMSIIRDIYRRHLALIYICVVFVSVGGLAIYFFRQFIWLVKGVIYDQTADTW